MQQSSTDIDRKLAIYYHPLFQETISLLTNLFEKDIANEQKNKKASLTNYPNQKHSQNKDRAGFNIGLMQFIEFNLKLQKCLLPTFDSQNAIISGLNDWVKQVAQCLNFQGMVITTQCEQINDTNFDSLLRTEIISSNMELYEATQKYIRTLSRLKNHDAFKLLGVKVNKQVFSKFMFDLCSTWCEFLDIEMFVYFLMAIYLQISEGQTLEASIFKTTHMVQPIELEFMEQFEEIKQNYSKNRKKQLRYYRAWCEWNYLRVGQVGEGLILCLDNILEDNRILQIALVFQKAIKVINEQITSQSQLQSPQDTVALKIEQKGNKDFLIMKKLPTKQNKNGLQPPAGLHHRQKSIQNPREENFLQSSIQQSDHNKNQRNTQKTKTIDKEGVIRIHSRNQTISEDQLEGKKNQTIMGQSEESKDYNQNLIPNEQHHDFQIQIDQFGNMYLKRIIKLPILGQKIEPLQFHAKKQQRLKWIQKKRQECRQVSNLYRRLQNMKVRLQHNVKNDHYFYKKNAKISERDKFYQNSQKLRTNSTHNQRKNMTVKQQPIFQKSIHLKMKPDGEQSQQNQNQQPAKEYAKPQGYLSSLKNQKHNEPLRKNADYIHKVIAPSFLTDHKNNISYLEAKQGSIYGVGAQDQRRDIKFNLPKIKFLKDYKVKDEKSYHIIGKLTKDRSLINQKVKSISMGQANDKSVRQSLGIPSEQDKVQKIKNQYRHIWTNYINQEEISELTNFRDFYQQIQKYKHDFSRQYESSYRKNLKPILLYENKRYEMGGVISQKQEVRFYEKIKKLINRDQRRKKRKQKKYRFRQYKKSFKNKNQRSFFEQVFIDYHKNQIKQIKHERSKIKSQIIQVTSQAN